MPRTSAIVVTHNNRADIQACLAALSACRDSIGEIVVVDHDSTDDTVDLVRREFPRVSLLAFRDNPGFGEGNNRGARVAAGEYLLLINPDATIDRASVEQLVGALEADPRLGIVVPKVVLAAEPTILNSAGLAVNAIGHAWDRGYLEWDTGQFDQSEDVLGGSGCVMLIRADRFAALTGFDPSHFLYYEDLDLCWRCWCSGATVRYVPAAVATHAMKVTGRPPLHDHYLDHRNRVRTLLKNMPGRVLRQCLRDIVLFEAGSAFRLFQGRQWLALWYRTKAWLWNLIHLPDTLRRRRVVQSQQTFGDVSLKNFLVPGRMVRLNAPVPDYREAYEHLLDDRQLSADMNMGSNEIGALGLGWYALETFEKRPARWCCGYGIAFLAPPAARSVSTLQITCAALAETEIIVRTDRQERGRFVVGPDQWQQIDLQIPVRGRVTRVELLVPSARAAGVHLPLNPRTLGVAVARLALVT